MFVDQLAEDEKQALMYLLLDISKADGALDKLEVEFLSAYALENGVELNLEEEISILDACKSLKSKKGKIVALQEIVKLAIVDGHYDEAERNGALIISKMLDIPITQFEEIEKWVLEGQEWVYKGFQMITEL